MIDFDLIDLKEALNKFEYHGFQSLNQIIIKIVGNFLNQRIKCHNSKKLIDSMRQKRNHC